MEPTCDEVMNKIDIKYFPSKTTKFYPCTWKINKTMEKFLPDFVTVRNTIDDIRLNSNLKNNLTLIFTKNYFFHPKLGRTQSQSGPLNDIGGFIQLTPGSYKSEKTFNITGFDNIHIKCDCFEGSIVNGNRELILNCFALDKPPGHEIYNNSRMKLFKKLNKSVSFHFTFNLEDNDQKAVDFNGETISFSCQLVKG